MKTGYKAVGKKAAYVRCLKQTAERRGIKSCVNSAWPPATTSTLRHDTLTPPSPVTAPSPQPDPLGRNRQIFCLVPPGCTTLDETNEDLTVVSPENGVQIVYQTVIVCPPSGSLGGAG